MTKDEYRELRAVNNSSLSRLNPDEGGSTKKFKIFMSGEEPEKITPYYTLGSTLHKWIEDRTEFVVEDFDKPSDSICAIVEAVHEQEKNKGEIFPAFKVILYLLQEARNRNYGKSWSDDVVVKKIVEGRGSEYLDFLRNSENKMVLSKAENEKFAGMVASLMEDDKIMGLLSDKSIKREVPIQFNYPIDSFSKEHCEVPCKALLDMVWIDETTGKIIVWDVKTGNTPLSKFYQYFRPAFDSSSPAGFAKEQVPGSFFYYRYYRQLAFYIRGLQLLYDYEVEARILYIETSPPYEYKMFYFNPNGRDIQFGISEIDDLMTKIVSNPDLYDLIQWNRIV